MKVLLCLCLLFFSAAPSATADNSVSYTQTAQVLTSGSMGAGCVADFNNDKLPDLAFSDNTNASVAVYLSKGDGTFASPANTSTSPIPLYSDSFACADFNEDGKQDIVLEATTDTTSAIQILAGKGDGLFTYPVTVTTPGLGALQMYAVDVNNDSHLDLVVSSGSATIDVRYMNYVTVFLGDGRGGFTQTSKSSIGLGDGLAVVDFDGDGNRDIFSAGPLISTSWRDHYSAAYLTGYGDGTFSTPVALNNSSYFYPRAVAAADFNGDGYQDILIGSTGHAFIYMGNGDGTFQLGTPYPLQIDAPTSVSGDGSLFYPRVAAADMNADGKPDAIEIEPNLGTLRVFLNTGTFSSTSINKFSYGTGFYNGNSRILIADFNADGFNDIAVAQIDASKFTVLLSIPTLLTPSVSLTNAPTQIFAGAAPTVTVSVTGTLNTPTGSLQLYDGTTSLGTQTLGSDGIASFTLSGLSTGEHSLNAAYAGDAHYAPATSSTATIPVTDFQFILSPANQTVTAGSSAAYSFILTTQSGFNGTVVLTCSGLPAGASCSSSSSSLNGAAVTGTLTVSTSATAALATPGSSRLYALPVAGLLFLTLAFRRRRKLARALGTSLCLLLSVAAFSGCSGGDSKPSAPVVTGFTVTATATQGTQTLSHLSSATITVQN